MAVTIKDIAKMTGVSISTVSRVINNSKPVNEKLRTRILNAMKETNFRPNAMARGLVKNESCLLGVVIPSFRYTVFDEMIEGINQIAKLYGYDFMLSLTDGVLENELHYLSLFREKQIDGIVFSSATLRDEHIREIEQSQIPCVLVGQVSHVPSIPSVHLDNWTAAYEVVTHFIQKGHRDIAMIRGPLEDKSAGDRRSLGYRQALVDAGLTVKDSWIVPSGFSPLDGREAMKKIAEAGKLPTAVFCASDQIAFGAMNYLMEKGYKVPDDISIFGFDGIDMTTIVRPKLSSVEYSAMEMGMTATRNLIKMIKGESILTQHTDVPHHLVFRDSVRSL